jgi:hypothetical protein
VVVYVIPAGKSVDVAHWGIWQELEKLFEEGVRKNRTSKSIFYGPSCEASGRFGHVCHGTAASKLKFHVGEEQGELA